MLETYLKLMVSKEASDLFLSSNSVPYLKIHGRMQPIGDDILSGPKVHCIAESVMSKEQIAEFNHYPELNLGISVAAIGRFRINIFQQRNETGLVIRHIKTIIPEFSSLGLPSIIKQLIMAKRGLILFVGATSSGKSTTIASVLDYRNQVQCGHIVTIEDPIEFIFENKKSLINQREVGIDTCSYPDALKNTLRQSPDVIFVGEIRNRETMKYTMTFAETGHLCVSTMHASNVVQALERIIHFFPKQYHQQILLDLSLNLHAIVSQRLVPSIDNKRVPAVELMIATPLMREMIRKGALADIHDVVQKSKQAGMLSFDDSLYNLFDRHKITEHEALTHADSKNNLRLRINLQRGNIDDNHK